MTGTRIHIRKVLQRQEDTRSMKLRAQHLTSKWQLLLLSMEVRAHQGRLNTHCSALDSWGYGARL